MGETVLVSIPRDTVNDESVRILSWKAPCGSYVEKEQLICEVETSKAVLEIHAPAAGILHCRAAAGDEVPVGAAICSVGPLEAEAPAQSLAAPAAPAARLTAAARALAAERGIDPASFPPGALVRRDDILRQARPSAPVRGVPVEWTDLPRRKILESRFLNQGRAQSLRSSITSVCRLKRLPAHIEEVGLLAAVVFETARLLKKYPDFNAIYDSGRIGHYGQTNIGWALDGGQGLVVPVIPEADRKGLREIATVMRRQIEAYLEEALLPADLLGPTFTVTDLSGIGVEFFEPLITEGQSAILGIGGADAGSERTVYFTLAFDHQLADGRKAALFLRDLSERLESHSVPEPEPVRHCMLCQRDSGTLQRMKLVLLRSEIPQGFVCSLCVAGW